MIDFKKIIKFFGINKNTAVVSDASASSNIVQSSDLPSVILYQEKEVPKNERFGVERSAVEVVLPSSTPVPNGTEGATSVSGQGSTPGNVGTGTVNVGTGTPLPSAIPTPTPSEALAPMGTDDATSAGAVTETSVNLGTGTVKDNKKSAFSADSLEFRDDLVNPALTSMLSISDQEDLSNKKSTQSADNLRNSSLMQNSGLPSTGQYNKSENLVKRDGENLKNTVEVGGIEPPDSWMAIPNPHQATPTTSPLYQKNSVLSQACPYCSSKNFVKRGTRQKKSGKTQLYICHDCGRTFTPAWTKGRQHGWSTVLEAVSYYNLGFSLEQTCQIMKEKFQVEIQPSTIATWVEDNKELCAYHRMRSFAVKHFSPYEVIDTCTLAHRQLYRFRYHRAKTKYILEDDFKHYKFYRLKEFLDNVSTETPHQYFQEGLRASEAPLKFSKTEMIVRSKENYATKLTELVFKGVSENKARHEALQRFLIANDSVTVATEVPVYIRREDLAHMQTQLGFKLYRPAAEVAVSCSKSQRGQEENIGRDDAKRQDKVGTGTLKEMTPDEIPKLITGHIDLLQIRNGSIHILDYKGEGAAKVRPIEQLTLYALALSRLTGLRLFYFKCAWFDEKDYFEFFPLHVVYKPGRGRKKIYTKEGVYNMNEKMTKIESLRPIDDGRTKLKIGKPNF